MKRSFVEALAESLARSQIFRSALRVPGDVVECGVLAGEGVLLWSALIELFAPRSGKKVVAFDTFRGFPLDGQDPTENNRADEANNENRDLKLSLDDVASLLVEHGLDSHVELVPGDARSSIPEYTSRNRGFRVSLLNLDFDLYEPSRVALQSLVPRIVPGGYILVDNYGTKLWGESDAVDETLRVEGLVYQSLPWTRRPRAFAQVPSDQSSWTSDHH